MVVRSEDAMEATDREVGGWQERGESRDEVKWRPWGGSSTESVGPEKKCSPSLRAGPGAHPGSPRPVHGVGSRLTCTSIRYCLSQRFRDASPTPWASATSAYLVEAEFTFSARYACATSIRRAMVPALSLSEEILICPPHTVDHLARRISL